MRLFFAIDLPGDVKEKISVLSQKIRQEYPALNASWIKPSTYHLTLAFLGETAQNQIEKILSIAQSVARSVPPLALSTESLGVFTSINSARVLWIGVHDKTKSLQTLVQYLQMALTAGFIKVDDKKFHPHISLARFRHAPQDAARINLQEILNCERIDSEKWSVTNFSLMESLTHPTGSPIYLTLENIPLGS